VLHYNGKVEKTSPSSSSGCTISLQGCGASVASASIKKKGNVMPYQCEKLDRKDTNLIAAYSTLLRIWPQTRGGTRKNYLRMNIAIVKLKTENILAQ
jgi:hypothetical protein